MNCCWYYFLNHVINKLKLGTVDIYFEQSTPNIIVYIKRVLQSYEGILKQNSAWSTLSLFTFSQNCSTFVCKQHWIFLIKIHWLRISLNLGGGTRHIPFYFFAFFWDDTSHRNSVNKNIWEGKSQGTVIGLFTNKIIGLLARNL